MYIDREGLVKFKAPYDTIFPFQNGLAEYQRKITSLNLGGVFGMVAGLAGALPYYGQYGGLTRDNVKRGYIDKSGTIVVDSKLEYVYPMKNIGT